MNFYGSFFFLLLGRYALVAFRNVNFNQIPKIIPKIPVGSFYSFIDNNIYWSLFLRSPENSSGPKSQLSNCNLVVLEI